MLSRWGTMVARGRWTIVALSIVFVAVAGVWGTSVFGALSGTSSLDDPSSEAVRTSALIDEEFGKQTFDVVGLYSSSTLTVDDPAFEAAVSAAAEAAGAVPGAEGVLTYYETRSPAMVSRDRHSTFVAVVESDQRYDGMTTAISKALDTGATSQITVLIGGQQVVDNQIGDQVPSDIAKAEAIATPILLIALLVVFGSVVAALMPLMIGVTAVLGAFLIVRVITLFTEVSIFAMNIITILGLGLAIDYGLFIVSRFREELAAQRDAGLPEDARAAIRGTMTTAGRTVLISGLLVTLSLCGLMLFPQVFLRSMGFGGAAAVGVAMVASLTLLPAVLVLLGSRIDRGRLPWARRRQPPDGTGGAWARVTRRVLRRPVLGLILVVSVLGVLAAPVAGVHFGGVDARMLPAGSSGRVVAERLAADFPGGDTYPIRVLVSDVTPQAAAPFAATLGGVPGVRTVAVAGQKDGASLYTVTYDGEPSSTTARGVVTAIRALSPPDGATVRVAGTPASVQDQLDSLAARLPLMAALVAGLTFLVLAIGFGSVLVPVKAIVMNLISISAAFGVVTWIFQEGHLSSVLGFTPTGYVEASQPVLMVAILFGLSMDYEVFLLSRIREAWDEGADTESSVIGGVQRTGRIISAAAVLLCIVIGFFATSGITFIKMIGVGMVVAILVDATLVRLVLVPVTMKLLGRANWWAPGFLQRAYRRFGIREGDASLPPAHGANDASPAAVT